MKTWLIRKEEGILLMLYIQPGASRNEIIGEYGDERSVRLKIKIKSPPVEGAANKELIKFFSKVLKISKSSLHLVRGHASRNKDIFIENINRQQYLDIVRIIKDLH